MIELGLDKKYKIINFVFKINNNKFLECSTSCNFTEKIIYQLQISNNELYISEKTFWNYCVKYNRKNYSIKKLLNNND